MKILLFVYGTLKRGCQNHRYLSGQTFVGLGRTQPGFRLYDLGGYPGIALHPDDTVGVVGEVWSVDQDALKQLDEFEGVHEGLYRRELLPLAGSFAGQDVNAYISALPVTGHPDVGSEWTEGRG